MSNLYNAMPGVSQSPQQGQPASAGPGPVLSGAQGFQQGMQQGGNSGLWQALLKAFSSNPPQANSGLQQGPAQTGNPSSNGPSS
jgi:hypothetical protein